MWNPFSKKVAVEFVENATGRVMARSELPPDQLPDTFAIDTTLHLPNGDWRVVNANPLSKQAFARSRQLKLWLERAGEVKLVNPAEILFTLPTISHELPACDGGEVDGSEMLLREDDWRQMEWTDDVPAVNEELASIRAIHASHRQGPGFNKLHVRKMVPQPLRLARLELKAVLSWLGRGESELKQIRLSGQPRRVSGGFAVRVDGGWVYGLASAGSGEPVAVLGYQLDPEHPGDVPSLQRPSASVVFVDWCRGVREDAGG